MVKDRRQQTVLNGFFSGWSAVEFGVPQGFYAWLLGFCTFFNDLHDRADLITDIKKFDDNAKQYQTWSPCQLRNRP